MSFTFATFRAASLAASATLVMALPALAADISVSDAYARSSGMMAKAGAAFMQISNTGAEDDRLIAATSDIARKVELHTHKIDENGVARMIHVEEGFVIPAGGSHSLARGGDHVMFMGLNEAMEPGKIVHVTLTFEKAGEVELEIPVDLDR
jgi:copper(I)-binding protein